MRELQRLQNADAAEDLKAAWNRGDRRFIGVNGIAGSMVIGIEMVPENIQLMQKHGINTIPRTADAISGDEQAQLQRLAERYATRYNQLLLRKLHLSRG